MNEENIPQSMRVAVGVTEAEYRKAKRQSRILWTVTMIAPLAGIGLWWMGLRLAGWMPQAILAGIGSHFALRALLPEAKKTSTMRLKKYEELKAYRAGQAKVQALKTGEREAELPPAG